MAQAQIKMPTLDDLAGMWQVSGLKQKLIFTFLMIAVFRFGAQIPIFGINSEIFANLAAGNNIVGFLLFYFFIYKIMKKINNNIRNISIEEG